MINRRVLTAAIAAAPLAGMAKPASIADDESIRQLLRRRIEVEKRTVGMAVCVVTADRQRVVTYGRERLEDGRPVSAETVFEIASVTKVFTALLLAEMALRGELAVDDPVARHLPGDFHVPVLDGRQITLADLATHTSGLPWWPTFPGQPKTFDADFTHFLATAAPQFSLEAFKAWLADFHPRSRPGDTWAYSNTGYAMLGLALAHRGGRPYEQLLQMRVLTPVGLEQTTFHPTAAMAPRLAEGHDPALKPSPPMELGIFSAAGGLLSTPRDLSRFAAAVLPGSRAAIAPAARLLMSVRRPAPPLSGMQALGWEVRNAPGGAFVSKDGVAWEQGASMAWDPDQRVAVVVFSNTVPDLKYAKYSGGGVGAADMAQHLLRPQIPLNGEGGSTY